MQGRSWMAALTLALSFAAAAAVVIAGEGDTTKTKPATSSTPKPDAAKSSSSPLMAPASVAPRAKSTVAAVKAHKVKLDLSIAGLTSKGCDVEIKAAHAGCKFRERTEHVDSNGKILVELDDVEILNADRDCTFAITIREAGQAEKTWRRGLRVNPTNAVAQTLPCYLNSPSKLARAMSAETKTKR